MNLKPFQNPIGVSKHFTYQYYDQVDQVKQEYETMQLNSKFIYENYRDDYTYIMSDH